MSQMPSLDLSMCRQRQQRLLAAMQEAKVDRAVLVRPEHVQYLTGFRPHRYMQAAVCLDADGRCLLVAPNRGLESAAADDVVTFEAQSRSTLRLDQMQSIAAAVQAALQGRPQARRVGVEFSCFGPHFTVRAHHTAAGGPPSPLDGAELVDLEPGLWTLRRRKGPDELSLIRRAIDCTEAMYARARAIIRPGITELEVFRELQAAAVDAAGEPLLDIGNDFQCNSPGGPPRPRPAQRGELFVLDLGVSFRGYYADNCRTFTVATEPTDAQHRAWQCCVAVLEMVEQTARPGLSCRQLFEQARQMLDQCRPDSCRHHLGHGMGLFPHEPPYLNPAWDHSFQEGDVFAAEPGLYGPDLKAGIRIEENYLVTSTGVEQLTSFPRTMV